MLPRKNKKNMISVSESEKITYQDTYGEYLEKGFVADYMRV